jgi:hypothetical protein
MLNESFLSCNAHTSAMSTSTNHPTAIPIHRRRAIAALGAAAGGLAIERGATMAGATDSYVHQDERAVRANDVRSPDILRHGAYLCLHVPDEARPRVLNAAVPTLVEQLALANEFETNGGHPAQAVAFLKRVAAASAQIDDAALLSADAIVHVAAPDRSPVDAFCAELAKLLGTSIVTRVLRGVVRPTIYTGNAMHNFAYAHQVVQQSGRTTPHAFVVPMSKTPAWWAKDWMERHTYFLPRYDAEGRMVREGHALAAAAGIACIMRRTYKSENQPAPEGTYDFVNYFECGEADVPTFEAVLAALRDVERNPEWQFVREGPMWRRRRVPAWRDLFA